MTIKFRDPITYRAPATQVDAVGEALYPIGTIAQAVDSTYGALDLIYLEVGSGVTEAVGSVVGYGGDYATVLAVAGGIYPGVAVSLSIATAGQFAWHVKRGNVPTKVASGYADNAKVYLTATPGTIDDAVVAGDLVARAASITATGTPSAGLAVIYFNDSATSGGLA